MAALAKTWHFHHMVIRSLHSATLIHESFATRTQDAPYHQSSPINKMSDTDSPGLPAAHPTTGGKSLQSFERPRYKSYRKKFRKMRHEFDLKLEENKQLFKDEYRLEAIAKRLREEIESVYPHFPSNACGTDCATAGSSKSVSTSTRTQPSLPNSASTSPSLTAKARPLSSCPRTLLRMLRTSFSPSITLL